MKWDIGFFCGGEGSYTISLPVPDAVYGVGRNEFDSNGPWWRSLASTIVFILMDCRRGLLVRILVSFNST
jgi:hypothetical protein